MICKHRVQRTRRVKQDLYIKGEKKGQLTVETVDSLMRERCLQSGSCRHTCIPVKTNSSTCMRAKQPSPRQLNKLGPATGSQTCNTCFAIVGECHWLVVQPCAVLAFLTQHDMTTKKIPT